MAHKSDLIASDIEAYLKAHEEKTLLRFITCGSVDDGKSTLIGRMLYESKMIFEDQLAALESDSRKMGTQGDAIDFALLVDGLRLTAVSDRGDLLRAAIELDGDGRLVGLRDGDLALGRGLAGRRQ